MAQLRKVIGFFLSCNLATAKAQKTQENKIENFASAHKCNIILRGRKMKILK
jgi:hypothetical protein